MRAGKLAYNRRFSAILIAASSSLHPNSRIIRIRSAFSCFSVIPSANHRAGETTRNSASTLGESTTPSVYFPGALVALSRSCRCSGVRDLKRLTCSTSSGGITSSSHHSIILSSFFASSGKLLRFCVASQCSGQLKLATVLEFFRYRFSDSFGGNPPLYSCGLSSL